MYKNYSFILFQNRKALLHDKDWTTYIETLITLDIIELTNREKLREKNKEFDFKFLKEKIDKATFELKNKRVNIDELIQKLDNYVMD